MDIPSIRINAVRSRLDSVNLDNFQEMVEKMAVKSRIISTVPGKK